jgi:hypothetical protein
MRRLLFNPILMLTKQKLLPVVWILTNRRLAMLRMTLEQAETYLSNTMNPEYEVQLTDVQREEDIPQKFIRKVEFDDSFLRFTYQDLWIRASNKDFIISNLAL